ncbi:MAG: hypothetical protein M1115_04805 [Actinobacteria bacterium]|nr:hypothetical protein [Actinomycetota bacterium]
MANTVSNKASARSSSKRAENRRSSLTPEHKAALSQGREEGNIVRQYLEALAATKPRRGRRRSLETVKKRLAEAEERLNEAAPFERLHLIQERNDLQRELEQAGERASGDSVAVLEKKFIKVARAYGERKGIMYTTWREAGVSAAVLEQAGIKRQQRA